ncbi:MAG TPA: efflux RND transporter periplasmic adaptor subunit [Blastocatellia bacterium]|nr:efflux RND transporter periplasmic adaptor subunit [Blastocatellia bacterium]
MIIAISAIASIALSCGGKQEGKAVKAPAIKVSIEKVAAGDIADVYEATGTVRSKTTSIISSRTMGTVLAVHVREGDRVRAGGMLIEIDSRDSTAQLQRAQAGIREAENALEETERNIRAAESAKAAAVANQTLARSTFNRYKALFERRSVSPQEFDQVQAKSRVADAEAERSDRMLSSLAARRNQSLARIDQAKAEVAGARVYASYARLMSPVNGIVIAKQVEVGSTAVPGAPLITVEDDSNYRLEAAVEESQIGKIQKADRVEVRIDALGDELVPGHVGEIVPAADPASRTYIVKIDLPARANLRSGSYGKARFTIGQRKALTVPQRAIVERGQLTGVYVVDESGTAHLRLIMTGKSLGDRIEVLSGLSDGERIVVDPSTVADGNRVESI